MSNSEDRSSSVDKDACHDLIGYNLQFLEEMSLYYDEEVCGLRGA